MYDILIIRVQVLLLLQIVLVEVYCWFLVQLAELIV